MKIWQKFLNAIFPIECLGCQAEGSYFCKQCQKNVVQEAETKCLLCNHNRAEKGICIDCQESSALAELYVVGGYSGTALEKVIHGFKFNYIEELATPLANLLALNISKEILDKKRLLIPVPLHKKRFLERGFNQSELLAKALAQNCSLVFDNSIVKRQNATKQQAQLARSERLANVKDAFVCLNVKEVNNKSVVILDDVLTTGATLQALARCLKDAGAKQVIGIALAHG